MKVIEKETQADNLWRYASEAGIKRLTNNQCNTEARIVFLDTLVCLSVYQTMPAILQEEVLSTDKKVLHALKPVYAGALMLRNASSCLFPPY